MIGINTSTREALKAYFKRIDVSIDEAEKERVVHLFSEIAAAHSTHSARSVHSAHSTHSAHLGAEQRCAVSSTVSFGRFVVRQLRFVNPLAWVAQVALLIAMLLLVSAYGESESAMLIVMIAAVLSVAIATPSVFKSFENNVAELEASCHHNATHVLVSRFILFGLGDVFWMTLAIWLVPAIAGGDPFRVFFYAATPFFAFCALSFYLSRITNGRGTKACIVAAIIVIVAIWSSHERCPHWYSNASMVVWSLALLVALMLTIYEAHKLLEQLASNGVPRCAPLAQT